jgi:hypothetical protein
MNRPFTLLRVSALALREAYLIFLSNLVWECMQTKVNLQLLQRHVIVKREPYRWVYHVREPDISVQDEKQLEREKKALGKKTTDYFVV